MVGPYAWARWDTDHLVSVLRTYEISWIKGYKYTYLSITTANTQRTLCGLFNLHILNKYRHTDSFFTGRHSDPSHSHKVDKCYPHRLDTPHTHFFIFIERRGVKSLPPFCIPGTVLSSQQIQNTLPRSLLTHLCVRPTQPPSSVYDTTPSFLTPHIYSLQMQSTVSVAVMGWTVYPWKPCWVLTPRMWPHLETGSLMWLLRWGPLDSVGEGKGGWFVRIALKHVYWHMWTRSPVQVRCMRQGAQGWCTLGWDGEGSGRDGGHMYTHGWFMSMYGKSHYNIVK